MSHVNYKKDLSVKFKKCPSHPVEFKKLPCPYHYLYGLMSHVTKALKCMIMSIS